MNLPFKSLLKLSLRWLCSRVFFVYATVFLLSLPFVNYQKLSERILALQMNHILPPNLSELLAMEKGKPLAKEAIEQYIFYYQTVLETIPDKAMPYSALGFLFYHQKEFKKATEMFEKSFQNNPVFPTFSFNLGYMYHQNKEYKKSNTVLLKTLQLNPQAIGMYLNYSFCYQQIMISSLKNSKEVITILQNHVSDAHMLMAQNFLLLKDYANLYSFAQKSIKSNISNKNLFHYYAGIAAYFLKDYSAAIKHFEIFAQEIRDPTALHYQALVYKQLGQKEKGEELLKESLSLRDKGVNPIESFLEKLHPHIL